MHKLLLERTALFDVDGTIVETQGQGHLPAFNAAFGQAGSISPRKGFVELIEAIHCHGGRWAVVTTMSLSNWQALWKQAILRVAPRLPEPALVVCGEDVAKKKPDPEAYELALQRLRLDSSNCVAIEDSRNGLIAARGAGIRTIIVRSQFFGGQAFPEAELVVNELSELL